jgi:hypothetical protein
VSHLTVWSGWVRHTRGGNGPKSKKQWENAMSDRQELDAGQLEQVLGAGRDGELNMIHLQSIMSQRQAALQLTTNILTSLDRSTRSVINNLGK